MERQAPPYWAISERLHPGQARAHRSFQTHGSWMMCRHGRAVADSLAMLCTARYRKSMPPGQPLTSSGNSSHKLASVCSDEGLPFMSPPFPTLAVEPGNRRLGSVNIVAHVQRGRCQGMEQLYTSSSTSPSMKRKRMLTKPSSFFAVKNR
jgi:hypothetical protein